jgi:hypothetical protein
MRPSHSVRSPLRAPLGAQNPRVLMLRPPCSVWYAAAAAVGDYFMKVCHYMTQPLVELYGGCMVVLKVS